MIGRIWGKKAYNLRRYATDSVTAKGMADNCLLRASNKNRGEMIEANNFPLPLNVERKTWKDFAEGSSLVLSLHDLPEQSCSNWEVVSNVALCLPASLRKSFAFCFQVQAFSIHPCEHRRSFIFI